MAVSSLADSSPEVEEAAPELAGLRRQLYSRTSLDRLPAHLAERYGVEVGGVSQLDLGVYRADLKDGSSWVARVFPAARPAAGAAGDADSCVSYPGMDSRPSAAPSRTRCPSWTASPCWSPSGCARRAPQQQAGGGGGRAGELDRQAGGACAARAAAARSVPAGRGITWPTAARARRSTRPGGCWPPPRRWPGAAARWPCCGPSWTGWTTAPACRRPCSTPTSCWPT